MISTLKHQMVNLQRWLKMTKTPRHCITLPIDILERLKKRLRPHQTYGGAIEELLNLTEDKSPSPTLSPDDLNKEEK